KSWSVPVRAKPCENQSLTESLFLTGFFVFSIYVAKISQSTRRHRVPRMRQNVSKTGCMRDIRCRHVNGAKSGRKIQDKTVG
ncbi:hypothetical protein, partial [uncultured Eubacterium sp.]|uniref:hypothetical protein n=1 Tax=uncultured Eubacterium sp. TaxID=165185 RepID=UPI0025DA4E7F